MRKLGEYQDSIEIVRKTPYFSTLDEQRLKEISEKAIQRKYDAGQVVFFEGEPCSGLFIVEKGWLKSVKNSPGGREQIVRFVGPGETFNEIGILTESTNQITVFALESSTVLIIPRDTIQHLLEEDKHFIQTVIQSLSNRVLHLMSLVEDLSLKSVEKRLIQLLLENSEDETLFRQRWSTQAEMASRIGTVPDVLNRVLHKLVDAKLIMVKRNEITILDKSGLIARLTKEK